MSLMLCVSDKCHRFARSNNGSKKNQNGIDKEGEISYAYFQEEEGRFA